MKKAFILATVFILGIYASYSQSGEEKQIISYVDFLKIVEKKLPQLETNELNQELTENILFKAKALHDVTISSSASGFGTKYYWNSEADRGTDYTLGFSVNGDVSTKLPSGTMLSLGGGYTQQHTQSVNQSMGINFDPATGSLSSSAVDLNSSSIMHIPSVKFGFSQPLIYNFFGFLDRTNKKDAKQKVEIGKLNKVEVDKQVLSYYRTVYFNAIQLQRTLENLRRSIKNAQRLEEQTMAKLRSGLAENDDLQRVRSSVFAYQDAYAQYEDNYNLMLNELKYFIDFDEFILDDNEFDRQVEESMTFEFKKISYDQTRPAKIEALERENLELARKAAKNRTLPVLELFGNLTVNFTHPELQNETQTGGTDYSKPNYTTVEFNGGINFRYSIGDHLNKGFLKDTDLSIKILDNMFEVHEKDFNKSMDNFITQVENLKERITIKEKMIQSLQSQYKTELAKYSQARVEMRNLLETDSNIFSHQNQLLGLKLQLIMFQYNYDDLTQ